jgi:hypothetical protein
MLEINSTFFLIRNLFMEDSTIFCVPNEWISDIFTFLCNSGCHKMSCKVVRQPLQPTRAISDKFMRHLMMETSEYLMLEASYYYVVSLHLHTYIRLHQPGFWTISYALTYLVSSYLDIYRH